MCIILYLHSIRRKHLFVIEITKLLSNVAELSYVNEET